MPIKKTELVSIEVMSNFLGGYLLLIYCCFSLAGNPANLHHCILCENALPTHAKAVQTKDMAPPAPVTSGQDRECSSCHRVNNPDARFCDWCGAKVDQSAIVTSCLILLMHFLLSLEKNFQKSWQNYP